MADEKGIECEIAMLRAAIHHLFDLANGENDLETTISIVRALGIASTRLAGLLRYQKLLGGSQQDAVAEAITTAIQETMNEMGIHL